MNCSKRPTASGATEKPDRAIERTDWRGSEGAGRALDDDHGGDLDQHGGDRDDDHGCVFDDDHGGDRNGAHGGDLDYDQVG